MSKTDHGTTIVNIGGTDYTLLFNLKAVKRIERTLHGLLPALQEVQKFSLNAAVLVIVAGAGLSLKPSEVEALEEAIYQEGIITVSVPLIEYLSGLLNPGARTKDELAETTSTESQGNE